MKRKSTLLLACLLVGSVTSCGEGSSIVPKNPHPEISYTDKLASKCQDGAILQAFNWKFSDIKDNLKAIADAGYTTVQTSPVQQPKSGGAMWQFFYQPVSFAIATSSPLGTKQELKELCEAADAYGIKIICDIVFNHLATDGSTNSYGLPNVDAEVLRYEPEIYNNQAETFHTIKTPNGSGLVTQVYNGLPDLNTAHPLVQERALSLLKECIDVGVDGFRFDAAKHIETSADINYPSSFWDNTLEVAKTYYREKTGKDLYAYGEILNDVEGGRPLSSYTKYMAVTENSYAGNLYTGVVKGDVDKIVNNEYGKSTDESNLVLWVESHDTYLNQDGSTQKTSDKRIAKQYAIVGARKDVAPMMFARTGLPSTVGSIESYLWQDELIAATNRFHNRFVDAEEDMHRGGENILVLERYSEQDFGAVIINLKGTDKTIVDVSHLPDGYYYDALTGNKIPVANGKAEVTFDDTGVAIITLTPTTPRARLTVSSNSTMFAGDLNVKVKLDNATNGTYKIGNNSEVSFTNETTISLGNNIQPGETVKVVIHGINGEHVTERVLSFTKITLVEGYVNILNVNPSYFTDYEVYIWQWTNAGSSSWSKDYIVQDGRMLFSTEGKDIKGFLLGLFPKGYTITNITAWDTNIIKQTSDISGTASFFNASTF